VQRFKDSKVFRLLGPASKTVSGRYLRFRFRPRGASFSENMPEVPKKVMRMANLLKAGSHIIAANVSIAAVNSKSGLTIGTII